MPRMPSRDAVAVYVSEKGYVCIKQENLHEDDSIIMLQPDQVPTIMTWLDDAMVDAKEIFQPSEAAAESVVNESDA